MNNPLVSIIVPVYNVQNSVARCLESICAQTWKDIEVILVNDGSRDESFSICEQFREKDPRIVLVDKSNSGVSETRNCGMSLARGKYVQFVDSDDYLDPDFTERLVTAAEANNADLVIAPYWMVIPANSSKATQAGYYYVQNPQSICHTQINLASIVQNKLQVFRYYKELYTKLGLYDQVQPQLYKFLTAFSENAYPSGSPQKIIMDMANHWGFGVLDASDKEKKHKTEPDA